MYKHHASLGAIVAVGVVVVVIIQSASAFAPPSGLRRRMHSIVKSSFDFFADVTPPEETMVAEQKDANGNVIAIGQKVAIVSHNNVRAHHVAKSSYGSFDSTTKQFLPQDESTLTRKTSCLLLPEGLRGEVRNVYDTNEWDRAHPILVEFGSDEDRNDGFSLPNTFTMHVGAKEITVVG
jgi:hypothetical protein